MKNMGDVSRHRVGQRATYRRKAVVPRLSATREPGSEAEWAMYDLARAQGKIATITARVAIAATVFSGIAAIFTGLQWYEAHSGSSVAKKQADATVAQAQAGRAQAEALVKTADAANTQIQIAERSVGVSERQAATGEAQLALNGQGVQIMGRGLKAQLRSEVSLTVALTNLDVGQRPIVSVGIKNNGPAISDLRVQQGTFLGPPSISPLIRPSKFQGIGVYMARGQISGLDRPGPDIISQGSLDAIKNGSLAIYGWAIVEYRDDLGLQRLYACTVKFGDGFKDGYACQPREQGR